jgi:hypothetical protein
MGILVGDNFDSAGLLNQNLNLLDQLQVQFQQKKDFGEAVVVTTSQDLEEQIQQGRGLAAEIGCAFLLRNRKSLKHLIADTQAQGVVVVESNRTTLQLVDGQKTFFHPNMARHRAEVLSGKAEDSMVTAMGLTPGQKVLDCTFGMGSDALIASLTVGEPGLVVGLEASLLLWALVRRGMMDYPWDRIARVGESLHQASLRIKLFNLDHREALKQLPDRSFDVVYFDPMFQRSIWGSNGIELVRSWGCQQRLEFSTVQEAVRVARHRVVVKERKDSPELAKLGFDRLLLGAKRISYGILEVAR